MRHLCYEYRRKCDLSVEKFATLKKRHDRGMIQQDRAKWVALYTKYDIFLEYTGNTHLVKYEKAGFTGE